MGEDTGNIIRLRAGDRAIKGFDDETGASITAFIPSPKGRKRKARLKNMSMVDVNSMARLELTMVEARVFWCLVAHVPPRSGSISYANTSQIAEECGMHPASVSQTLKKLKDRRIIRRIRQGAHHINTWIAYSGTYDDWNATDETEAEPLWHRHGVDPVTGVVL